LTHKFSVTGHEGYLTVGLYEDGQPGELFITMAKEGSTIGGLMDVIGTCTSMALQYGVPLITLVDKFRHARFEPAGMTSNRDIPFAKSLIDYIFCWLGCQFIPGYAEANTPNRTGSAAENKNITTARQVVEKTRDLAQKIAQAKAETKLAATKPGDLSSVAPALHSTQCDEGLAEEDDDDGCEDTIKPSRIVEIPNKPANRLAGLTGERAGALVTAGMPEKTDGETQSDAAVMQQFNSQFQHFQDDAPACDICGSITVRNGTCYKCFNCGNSMGCS